MSAAEVMVKMVLITKILNAAKLLHEVGLIDEHPNVLVKRYVLANPDINEYINSAIAFKDKP